MITADMNLLIQKLLTLILATGVSLATSKISIQIANGIGLIDQPNSEPHKTHQQPTPIAGGISLVLSLLVFVFTRKALLGNVEIDDTILWAVLLLFLSGIIDDFLALPAVYKLFFQIAAGVILISGNHQVHLLDSQFLNIAISLFWFVGIINAFNFIDSSDGLMLSVGIIICGFITAATLSSDQSLLNTLAVGFLGLLAGLLAYNRKPAKMFLGDSGSQVIGLIVSLFALTYNPLGFDRTTSWISPILMLAFPIFDVSLVVVSRLKRNLPVFHAQLDHSFHRLQEKFHNGRIANLIILGLTAATNLLSVVSLYLHPAYAYSLFGLSLFFGVLLIFKFEHL